MESTVAKHSAATFIIIIIIIISLFPYLFVYTCGSLCDINHVGNEARDDPSKED